METRWRSLYLHFDERDRILATLRDALTSLDYTLYDPFSAFPGASFPLTARMFVAPVSEGWTRILGTIDPGLLPALSNLGLCIDITLDAENSAAIGALSQGDTVDPKDALASYLRPGRDVDDLRRALDGDNNAPVDAASDGGPLPFESLPGDVQAMAENLNPKHINRLFSKMMGSVGKRLGGDQDAARALLSSGVNWDSRGGQKIRAVIACLTIPDPYWREPDFVTLRDAYQLRLRLAQNPGARLYPGDEEAMQAAPDALQYTPVYGGKSQPS